MIYMRARQIERELRAKRRRPMTDSEYRVHRSKDRGDDLRAAEGIAAAVMLSVALCLIGALILAHCSKAAT